MPIDYSILDRPDVLSVLFHPRKIPSTASEIGQHFKEVSIPVESNIHIGSRFHVNDTKNPTILFFHGNGEIVSDYDDIGPLFNRLGINFIVVDYRGYGRSDGNPGVASMMADCHRIFEFVEDWLEKKGCKKPMVIMGRSLGSASALELAAAYPDRIGGLIVESGFAWAGPLLRLLGIDPDRIGFKESHGFSNVDKIRTVTKPTTIIHAEFDHIIPFADGQTLYDACGAEKKEMVAIDGANHNDIFMRGLKQYLQAIGDLVRECR